MTPEHLHYLLTRHVIEHGHAPDLAELGTEAEDALQKLSDMHGVILEPNSLRIWSLHPFALMPSAFWVASGANGWWANCAWCSLAIGAALKTDITINTRDGAEGDPLTFEIREGVSTRPELLMHFPRPPARWWDNPYCPCGNILFFTTETQVDQWCARHGRPKGALLNMPKAIELAKRWFGDYAQPNWRRKTPAQVPAIFAELKLDPTFWNLEAGFR